MKINNVRWKILFVSPNHPALQRSDGSFSIGCCDNKKRTIYVNSYLSSQKLYKVLCHEITHAAMFSYHIDLSIDQEELIADLIATYGAEIINKTNQIFSRLRK